MKMKRGRQDDPSLQGKEKGGGQRELKDQIQQTSYSPLRLMAKPSVNMTW